MHEARMKQSPKMDTRVIYDRETGAILHIHQSVALPGIELPDDEELNAAAIELATKATGRSPTQIEVLNVGEELKTGHAYRVNVQERRLVAQRRVGSASS
jgi:hypothetical protein